MKESRTLPNVPPSTEDHIEEHMPWEHLTIPPQRDRRVLVYATAAGLIAAVLGVVMVRQFRSPAPLDPPAAAAVQETAPPPAPAVDRPAPAEPANADAVRPAAAAADLVAYPAAAPLAAPRQTEPEVPAGLSEADLAAPDTEGARRKAAGTAEWIVLEFFTLDPSDPWRDRVEAAMGLRLPPDAEPDAADNPAVSYVEWTRTQSVEQTGGDTFRASVLIRRLVAPDGETYERLPAEQVHIDLRLEPDGEVRAASLPELIPQTPRPLNPMEEGPIRLAADAAGIGWPSTRR